MYHASVPRGAQLRRCSVFSCKSTFVPGGTNGVALKFKNPLSAAYADNFGLNRQLRRRFKVSSACGIKRSHSAAG
jgi:hypothetical protein